MKGYCWWKYKFYRLCARNSASGLLQIGRKIEKRHWCPKSPKWHYRHFFDFALLLLSSLVTGPSFMSISSRFLELCQFYFLRDWPEIRKLEIPPSDFYRISGDWGKLGNPNLVGMSLIKCYWMLQNSKVTAFSRENQQCVGLKLRFPPIQIRVKS